ncbi:MAG: hypothetical protein A3K06_02540 [Candidatus Doudnabacteria bacterium RIFCSPHIGHO2_01_52_17]|uniref:Uncharacterized protein n=1 Tax=Candidatus Doudnabacteria bacterium RIFCSPHIGHO2_01_52_17 TaxID=1817820 RepID=A0A1F5NEA2_9BACT|nr:MAG: hypothetical protein A3K06_02540 [Candidatus Doudnabacteria bacterium RIFCSPHIGHO2_01_52_17]
MERLREWLRKPVPRIRQWMLGMFGVILLLYSGAYLWWAVWFFEKVPEAKRPTFIYAAPVVWVLSISYLSILCYFSIRKVSRT